jgi:hypothetical protein
MIGRCICQRPRPTQLESIQNMGLHRTGVLYTPFCDIYIFYGQNIMKNEKAPDYGVPCFKTKPYESILKLSERKSLTYVHGQTQFVMYRFHYTRRCLNMSETNKRPQ